MPVAIQLELPDLALVASAVALLAVAGFAAWSRHARRRAPPGCAELEDRGHGQMTSSPDGGGEKSAVLR